jgi:hypothetical protein
MDNGVDFYCWSFETFILELSLSFEKMPPSWLTYQCLDLAKFILLLPITEDQ